MAACLSCNQAGGLEAFQQNSLESTYSIPDAMSLNSIPCNKDFSGCMYSAQGAIVCSQAHNKEPFIPGMTLGGIPNMGISPLIEPFASQLNATPPQPVPSNSFYTHRQPSSSQTSAKTYSNSRQQQPSSVPTVERNSR